ncbi:MAG TPA: universal stress protein, partial [Ilumatobacteraceae bacterium]|nr:universal stress protein [Ilumatobacteraceae bacterium]
PPHPRIAFTEAGFSEVNHLYVENDPRLALSQPASLLVIGPRGPGLAKALHLGSTAEWLITRPPSPMLIPRHGRVTRSVTVCHDGSSHATVATQALARMPWIEGVAVTVLAVDDSRSDPSTAVEEATAILSDSGAVLDARMLVGDPTQVILRHLERHGTDLLVFGTSGLTGLQRLRVGSTASALAHATDLSILVACDHSVYEA